MPLASAAADGTQWIWSPEHESGSVPEGTCYFRKSFTLDEPAAGDLKIAADDEYEAYLNGRRIGTGGGTGQLDQYDVGSFLRSGENLLAVRVTNRQGSTAALGVRLTVKARARGLVTISSDASWLTNVWPLPLWQTPLYNDSRWANSQALGLVGRTPPWDDVPARHRIANMPAPEDEPAAAPAGKPPAPPAGSQMLSSRKTNGPAPAVAAPPAPRPAPAASPPPTAAQSRRKPPAAKTAPEGEDQFVVEQVLDGQTTGSLLAVSFNEFGHAIASREQGGLLLIHDSNRDGLLDQVRVASDQIKDCRGLLCLNGELFATGKGPEGLALYRLTDQDRDGQFDQLRAVLKFEGNGGQYGPHGVVLGTDGFLYVAVGCQDEAGGGVGARQPLSRLL